MSACRFVASDEPRVLMRRHEGRCVGAGPHWHPPIVWVDCSGCLPCPEAHCVVCGRNHAAVTCTDCLAATRSDLAAIGALCGALPEEAIIKGVDSEAMMLLGPVSDPEAWKHRMVSAAYFGRLNAAYLEDCRDELHPAWVIGDWERIWRDHLDHHTEEPFTITSGWAYLNTQLSYMADQPEPAFEDFARLLGQCRSYLEDVVRDGVRQERTRVPCTVCDTRLIKVYSTKAVDDHWSCPRCKRTFNAEEFARAKQFHLASEWADKWVRVAEALAAIVRPEQTLRAWMRNGDVKTDRDAKSGAILVWWPDVRIMHLNTPTRNRRSA